MNVPIDRVYFPVPAIKTVQIRVNYEVSGRDREPVKILGLIICQWPLGNDKVCDILNFLKLVGCASLLVCDVENGGK